MILRSCLFRRVGIVGLGLMGGSLALSLKKNKVAKEIIGISQQEATVNKALKNGVIDQPAKSLAALVKSSDLIILAAPVQVILKVLPEINEHLRRSTIVMDVGSSKLAIVEQAQKVLQHKGCFMGAHPLAGSELQGVEHARDDLFENQLCVLTPTDDTYKMTSDKIQKMWTMCGAKVQTLSAEDHDRKLAYVSHMPHLLAFAMMNAVPDNALAMAAGGFRDVTRIASSSPQMWADISLSNSREIVLALDKLVEELSCLRKSVLTQDQKTLRKHFAEAKNKRNKWLKQKSSK